MSRRRVKLWECGFCSVVNPVCSYCMGLLHGESRCERGHSPSASEEFKASNPLQQALRDLDAHALGP